MQVILFFLWNFCQDFQIDRYMHYCYVYGLHNYLETGKLLNDEFPICEEGRWRLFTKDGFECKIRDDIKNNGHVEFNNDYDGNMSKFTILKQVVSPIPAYLVSKLAFLLSLVLAIALNPQRLFFLLIIVPAVLLLFVIYGLFSRWVGQRTGQPAVAGIANALAFGCFIAVTFPLVG